MSWIFFAFGSIIFFTSLNLLQKVISTEAKDPRAMSVVFNSVAASFAILIFIFSGSYKNFVLPTQASAWITMLIAALCYGLFERWRFLAAKLLDASIMTTVMNINVLVAFIGSLFLYSESLTVPKLIGGGLIMVALLIVSISKTKNTISKQGLIVASSIAVLLGVAWMLDKLGAQSFNPETYSVFVWVIPIVFIYFPKVKVKAMKTELKRASYKLFILSGLNVLGYLMQLKALELTEATKVIPVIQTTTLFTILLGIFFLGERENMAKKFVAGILAVVGAYFLI